MRANIQLQLNLFRYLFYFTFKVLKMHSTIAFNMTNSLIAVYYLAKKNRSRFLHVDINTESVYAGVVKSFTLQRRYYIGSNRDMNLHKQSFDHQQIVFHHRLALISYAFSKCDHLFHITNPYNYYVMYYNNRLNLKGESPYLSL